LHLPVSLSCISHSIFLPSSRQCFFHLPVTVFPGNLLSHDAIVLNDNDSEHTYNKLLKTISAMWYTGCCWRCRQARNSVCSYKCLDCMDVF
jgi:hypothetical protein